MNKSIIISYRESSEERKFNLQTVLDYLSYIQDNKTEILIIEQDTESKIDWLPSIKGNEFIKHIFVENDGIFNKGWGYNIGAKAAVSDILIFHDSDLILRPQTYNLSISFLENYDIVTPYKSIVYLDENSTRKIKDSKYSFNIANGFSPIITGVISGGIFMIKKSTYIGLKGFDEDCYGYGHEDDIFDEKARKMDLTIHTINDTSLHLFHKVAKNNNDLYYSFLAINKQLFSDYINFTKDDIINKINSIEDWGDDDKSTSSDMSIRHIKRDVYEKTSKRIIDYSLSKFTDEFVDELVNDISSKIYNSIVEIVSEKVKSELLGVSFGEEEKVSILRKVMKKFKI